MVALFRHALVQYCFATVYIGRVSRLGPSVEVHERGLHADQERVGRAGLAATFSPGPHFTLHKRLHRTSIIICLNIKRTAHVRFAGTFKEDTSDGFIGVVSWVSSMPVAILKGFAKMVSGI